MLPESTPPVRNVVLSPAYTHTFAPAPPPSGGGGGPAWNMTIGNTLGSQGSYEAPIGGSMNVTVTGGTGYTIVSAAFSGPTGNMVKSYYFGPTGSGRTMMTSADMSNTTGVLSWWWDHHVTPDGLPYAMTCVLTVQDQGGTQYQHTFYWSVAVIKPSVTQNTAWDIVGAVSFVAGPSYLDPRWMGFQQPNLNTAGIAVASNVCSVKVSTGDFGGIFGVVDVAQFNYTWTPVSAGVVGTQAVFDSEAICLELGPQQDDSAWGANSTGYLANWTTELASSSGFPPTVVPTIYGPGAIPPIEIGAATTIEFAADSHAVGQSSGNTWVNQIGFTETHKWMCTYQAVYGGGGGTPGTPVSVADSAYTLTGSAVYNGATTNPSQTDYLNTANWTASGSAAATPTVHIRTGFVDFIQSFSYAKGQFSPWPLYDKPGGSDYTLYLA